MRLQYNQLLRYDYGINEERFSHTTETLIMEKGMKFESVGFQQVSEEWYSYYLRV